MLFRKTRNISNWKSQLLSKAATDVTSVLHHQLQTLEETKRISQIVPVLQQSSDEASALLKTVLESLRSSSAVGEDLFNMKENVEVLTRLALGMVIIFASTAG